MYVLENIFFIQKSFPDNKVQHIRDTISQFGHNRLKTLATAKMFAEPKTTHSLWQFLEILGAYEICVVADSYILTMTDSVK